MSETTQSTVEDFEKEFETTGTDDDPTSTQPGKGDGGLEVKDEHTPISPEADGEDGALVTMDEHTPIGAESVKEEGPGK